MWYSTVERISIVKKYTKLCSSLTLGILMIVNSQICVQAENTDLNDNVLNATLLMEELLNQEYNATKSEIEDVIQKNEWNYTLTMESFYNNGNPYDELDYQESIAAVCTIMNHSHRTIADINFLEYSITESSMETFESKKTDKYIEVEDGVYEKKGTYYITMDGIYPTYSERGDGYYEQDGTEKIVLDSTTIKYGEVDLKIKDNETLFVDAEITFSDVEDEYNERLDKIIASGIDESYLEQSIFIQTQTGNNLLTDDAIEQLQEAAENTTGNRLNILNVASTLIGRVPYQWGGKSTKSGYDTSWYTFENGEQKGLDCSGYVQWVYRTAGYSEETWQQLLSTSMIMQTCEQIPVDELQVGDLGILNTGETTNHVGIYIGNGYYIHCNASDKTVSISKPKFTLFYRVPTVDEETLFPVSEGNVASKINYTNEELYLVAQTVWHEARGEGANGWIAVAEVIKNRVLSTAYPEKIYDVIYQDGQFSYNGEITNMTPPETEISIVKMVLDGNISILGNENIMWFRNPAISTSSQDWNTTETEVISNTELPENEDTVKSYEETWNGHAPYMIIGHHVFYI